MAPFASLAKNPKMEALTAMNSRGQATLEAVVCSLGLFAFVAFLFTALFFSVLHTYLQFSSHELLVCRQIQNPNQCDSKFRKELQSFLPFGRVGSVSVQTFPSSEKLFLVLHFSIPLKKEVTFKYQDEIHLPLRSS